LSRLLLIQFNQGGETLYLTKRLIFFELDSSSTLLINTLSGAVDKVSNDIASKLKEVHKKEHRKIDFELESNVEDHLKQRGYLFETLDDEQNFLLDVYEKSRIISSQSPVKFVICPTYSCNLACTYCYEGDLRSRNEEILDETKISAIFYSVDEILNRMSITKYLFELFGGEPFLNSTKSIIEIIFKKLRQRKEAVAIVTNGTNIIKFKDLILEYWDIIDSIQITLDGPKKIHDSRRKYVNGSGSFDEIVQGIDFLLELGINVRIRVNVDKENIYQLPELITFVERKNWSFYQNFHCDIAPVTFHTSYVSSINTLNENQTLEILLDQFPNTDQLRKVFNFEMFRVLNYISSIVEPSRQHISVLPSFHYCEANNLECYVFGPDNYIYACPDAIVDKKYSIGTYYPDLNIDQNKQLYWKRNILTIPKCKECEVATFCGGGCALVPLERGEIEPDCNGTKETLLTYLTNMKIKNYLQ
jgi:uncharacterized protein